MTSVLSIVKPETLSQFTSLDTIATNFNKEVTNSILVLLPELIETEILSLMEKTSEGWSCRKCDYVTRSKQGLVNHIERRVSFYSPRFDGIWETMKILLLQSMV